MKKVLLVLAGVALFGGGYAFSRIFTVSDPEGAAAAIGSRSSGIDYRDYPKTWQLIKEHHVDGDAKDEELFYGSIKGMVDALDDPYSAYFPPKEAEMVRSDMAGSFTGIGAMVGKKDDRIIIVSPIEGGPAERAGLKPDDIIMKVDGKPTYRMALNDVVMKIRGKKGTPVVLTIWREGLEEPIDITIVRDDIETVSVKWSTVQSGKKTYMVITLAGFHEDTLQLFSQAVTETLAIDANGIILDLRNNPGGLLNVAIGISCHWLPEAPAVWQVPRGEPAQAFECSGEGPLQKMPTVVLVNKSSASASEITAGALQDYSKAYLIGETTYGKGCGQSVIRYDDGSELHLTTFLWETGKRRSIHEKGIEPDLELKTKREGPDKPDPQLERAIRYLNEGH